MSKALITEQIDLETSMVSRGVERYFAARTRDEERGRAMDGSVVGSVLTQVLRKLNPAVAKLQAESQSRLDQYLTVGGRPGVELQLCALDSQRLSYIALKTALVEASTGARLQRTASTIGRMASLELQWDLAKKIENASAKERGNEPPNRIKLMKHHVKQMNPRTVKQWLKRMDDIETKPWERTTMFQVGVALLHTLIDTCPEVVQLQNITTSAKGRTSTLSTLVLTAEFSDLLAEAHADTALKQPWLLPMICPPEPWVEAGDGITGGYLKLPTSLVKQFRFNHTSSEGVNERVLRSMNVLQATPWQINRRVLAVAGNSLEWDVGPLPYEPPMTMPENISSEAWNALDREGRGIVKHAREEVHSHNNSEAAKKLAADRVVAVAEEFEKYDELYFPHSIDWRGRAYPLPQDLHPQADDFAKSLLTFAEAKPLG